MEKNCEREDHVTVYLAIESVELKPSELTRLLGVPPDREWLIGSERGRTGKLWDRSGWIVETEARSEDSQCRPASELIPIAIANFERKVAPFSKMAAALGTSVERCAVLAIVSEQIPGIQFSHSFLKLLSDLDGTFQIDLMA